MIAGKVMMDRGAPAALLDTAESGYRESKALIERWHGRGRLQYAISPRFAVTSSDAQLEAAGALLAEHPGCYLQTHLCENLDEITTVRRLFPWAKSYTDVYDRFGLLGPRSLFGHCIHLDEGERERLSASRSVAALCPTSNLFLGSGLFDLAALRDADRPVRLALATDIGGGTSYSMLRTAAEAYKVVQLRGQHWSALEAFYAITLGNARALGLEARDRQPRARHRGGHRGARRARDAGHGASHGDRPRSRRGAVRAPDHGRRAGGARHLCDGRAGCRGPEPESFDQPSRKFSSSFTPFGSCTKICRMRKSGSSLVWNATPRPVSLEATRS